MENLITGGEEWLDYSTGEVVTLLGKLSTYFPGTEMDPVPALLIRFADWSNTLVTMTSRPARGHMPKPDSDVYVKARRTEDGLEAIAIWQPNTPVLLL